MYVSNVRKNRMFTKNKNNYMNELGKQQLPTLGRIYLIDVFLNNGNIVEPHYHSNASELLYCVTGTAIVSLINPFANELKNIQIKRQQVISIPRGWWHYFIAKEDNTHILTIYDTDDLHTVWGSDVLRLTPKEVFSQAYCLHEKQTKQTLAAIKDTVIIGPPLHCLKQHGWDQRLARSAHENVRPSFAN